MRLPPLMLPYPRRLAWAHMRAHCTAAAQVRELAAQTIHYDKHYAGWNLADALVGQLWFKQA